MNRFDRITAILIQLQSKKVVKAQDLADRFDISLRTVYRDIRTLEEAGVPLYGEAGVGYSIVDGYRLPPVMFTRDEAMAFITAEKLMEKFTDQSLQTNFSSAMYKIKSVLRSDEKDLLENLDGMIQVKDPKPHQKPSSNILDTILKAIAEKKVVEMEYRAFGNEQNSNRLLEPIGIFHEHENWYTIGYCHLRQSYRQFRIDRVIAIKITNQDQEERSTLKEFQEMQEKARATFTLQKAVLRVEKSTAMYLQGRKHYYGFVSETVHDNYVDMTFLSQYLEEGLARWFLMFADRAEILEPESLKNTVNAILDKIVKKVEV